MIELEGAADAERAVDEAKAALEELAVHLKLYGEGLENEGLDTFDAIGVNTVEKEVPGSAASRLGEAADLLARRPSEALPGRRPTRGRSNRAWPGSRCTCRIRRRPDRSATPRARGRRRTATGPAPRVGP